jgi:hypothetical protein
MSPQTPDSEPELTVGSISDDAINKIPSEPDPTTKSEIAWQDKAGAKSAFQDIDERKKYANQIFCLVAVWLVLMGVILLWQGFNWNHFQLSDSVLIAVVTTTTIGVVGLLLVVAKYLFHPHDPSG